MSDSPTIAGIYPPVPTFFDEREDLDLATLREHLTRLKAAGIANIVALGSNGEAVHLVPDERRQVIATVRETMGAEAQVLAGVGEHSTRATLALAQLAT
jgi:dihydrodipicolinate synthase/N-acetylneuraminate lyase